MTALRDGTLMFEAADSSEVLLQIRGLAKRFGPVVACDDIDLDLRVGEIHGVLGENGAGKTTLMKLVAGVERPDAGQMLLDGGEVRWRDPLHARGHGVGMVHQHLSLVGPMPVWRNILLGERSKTGEREALRRIHALSARYGLDVDASAVVDDLAAGQRQRVELLKCLWREPRVLILDEPTAMLSLPETEQLWTVLRSLVADGRRVIVLVSHRLQEVLRVTDRVTVLRQGKVVARLQTADSSADELAEAMLGRRGTSDRDRVAIGAAVVPSRVGPAAPQPRPKVAADTPPLQIADLHIRGREGHFEVDGLNLTVQTGEIVGLAGVEGNGQDALLELFAHLRTPESGRVLVHGHPWAEGRRYSGPPVGMVPVDRHDSGCIPSMSVAENLVLGYLPAVSRRGVLNQRAIRERALELITEYGIKAESPDVPMWTLSGGNQQRVILARELSQKPPLLIAGQPTRGLDVGAMRDTWDLLTQAASDGAGILLVSTDLDEVLALADRIAVIFRGRILGEMSGADVDIGRLGHLMGGRAA